MSTPQPGERRRFIPAFALDREYADHAGQTVMVMRGFETAPDRAFYVRANDGWTGAAFVDELEKITE